MYVREKNSDSDPAKTFGLFRIRIRIRIHNIEGASNKRFNLNDSKTWWWFSDAVGSGWLLLKQVMLVTCCHQQWTLKIVKLQIYGIAKISADKYWSCTVWEWIYVWAVFRIRIDFMRIRIQLVRWMLIRIFLNKWMQIYVDPDQVFQYIEIFCFQEEKKIRTFNITKSHIKHITGITGTNSLLFVHY
jgi:hypothetical protein